MSYDVGVKPNAPDPIFGSEPKIIPAWNEIDGQFTQGSSFLPINLRVTMFFDENMITTTLEQCAKELQVAVMDAFDQYFSPSMLSFIWALIPTRSGKLADLIMQSILIYKTQNSRTFIFNIPQGYPLAITNPKHNGEIGYGKKYIPTYTSPLINKIQDTSKGAYYLLSDPIAEPNYLVTIQNYIFSSMYQLVTYLTAMKWSGSVWIKQETVAASIRGTTTTKNQTDISSNPTNFTVPLSTLSTAKDLWEDQLWMSLKGEGEVKNQIGSVILYTQRLARYKWSFSIIFPATVTKMTLGK